MKAGILLLCVLILSLTSRGSLEQAELSPEEYDVYSAYLNGIEKRPKDGKAVGLLVINNQTKVLSASCSQASLAKYNKRIAKDELTPLFEDIQNKSKDPKPIKKLFSIRYDYVLLGEKDFTEFFKSKGSEGWDEFYKKYPTSSGYIGLSRVGFNTTFTKAIIFRTESCGSLCSSGDYVLFEKINGRWQEVDRFNCWMS